MPKARNSSTSKYMSSKPRAKFARYGLGSASKLESAKKYDDMRMLVYSLSCGCDLRWLPC